MTTVGSATNYLETLILGWSLAQNPTPLPVSTTLGLFTAIPSDLGTDGTEVTGGAYARQTVIWGAPVTDSRGNTYISNNNTIDFPQATANWGVIVAGAVFAIDSNSVSRMIYWGDMYPVETVNTGQVFQVLPGDLVIGVD
jgi:hypothetical protein